MPRCSIILLLVSMATGCQPLAPPPPVVPLTPVVMPGPVAVAPPVLVPNGPVMIESQPITPLIPGPPLPAPTAVPPVVWPQQSVPAASLAVAIPPLQPPTAAPSEGISSSPIPGLMEITSVSSELGFPVGPALVGGPLNPLTVPATNDDLAWEQIADVVSDYFPIASERRARRFAGVWSEGMIETAPQSGATFLEPHRRDSVGEFNRWESTFQTIRRRALVRVTPTPGSYVVAIEVQKELEDLPRPERSTAGAATLRTDGSLPPRDTFDVSRTRESSRWIRLGRDVALEQRMLADLQARFGAASVTGSPFAAR